MKTADIKKWLPLLAAVILALVSLTAAADPSRQAMGLAATPFGWTSVVVVHTIATLPLAWMVAAALGRLVPIARVRGSVVVWIALGGLVAALTAEHGPWIGHRLHSNPLPGPVRLLLRLLWCLTLLLPWAFWARAEATAKKSPGADRFVGRIAAALLVAVLLPAAYVDDLAERKITAINQHLAQSQLTEAMGRITGLRDLGIAREKILMSADPRLADPAISAATAHARLEKLIEQYREEIAQLRRQPPTEANRIVLAQRLAMLGQTDPARRALGEVADRYADAARFVASTYRQDQQWENALVWYHKSLRLAKDAVPESAESRTQVQAWDGVAFCLRELRRFHEAEQTYLEAIEKRPDQEAYFRYQLGLHYRHVGRPLKSLEQLQAAEQLDPPTYAPRVAALLKQNRTRISPGCFLRARSRVLRARSREVGSDAVRR